jgi:hypothetical protein
MAFKRVIIRRVGPLSWLLGPMKIRAIHSEHFFHDGRGPTLESVHFWPESYSLAAIDFVLPDDSPIKHLVFARPQVFIFTPEEVANYSTSPVPWSKIDHAALVSLGKSDWLNSFAPTHLGNCEHFRAMFYDEYLDIICEDILVGEGRYVHVP